MAETELQAYLGHTSQQIRTHFWTSWHEIRLLRTSAKCRTMRSKRCFAMAFSRWWIPIVMVARILARYLRSSVPWRHFFAALQVGVQRTLRRNRLQEVAEIGSSLKGLAQELRIPVVVEAPLPRTLENHYARHLRPLDTRPGRERSVDQVLHLSCDHDSLAGSERTSRITIIIAGREPGGGDESSHFIQLR